MLLGNRATWLRLLLLLVGIEAFAVFFLRPFSPGLRGYGMALIALVYMAVVAFVLLLVGWGGTAWPCTYDPPLASAGVGTRSEARFAFWAGAVDSYLTNASRADEMHPLLTELARERLLHGHGIDLDDRKLSEPVLGPSLSAYLFAPPQRSMAGRTERRLHALIEAVEAL